MPILLASIAVNYAFGRCLTNNRSKKVLMVGIAFNLLFLGYFKYTNFILENINYLFNAGIAMKNIVLPLGISFLPSRKRPTLLTYTAAKPKRTVKAIICFL